MRQGIELRVGFIAVLPYFDLSADGSAVGRLAEDVIELGSRLNASLRWIPSVDGKYGSQDEATGEWNGLIKVGIIINYHYDKYLIIFHCEKMINIFKCILQLSGTDRRSPDILVLALPVAYKSGVCLHCWLSFKMH